jgi:hypothetical protein
MVVLGHPDTTHVTLADMEHHAGGGAGETEARWPRISPIGPMMIRPPLASARRPRRPGRRR